MFKCLSMIVLITLGGCARTPDKFPTVLYPYPESQAATVAAAPTIYAPSPFYP